jgi:hypothetical protein
MLLGKAAARQLGLADDGIAHQRPEGDTIRHQVAERLVVDRAGIKLPRSDGGPYLVMATEIVVAAEVGGFDVVLEEIRLGQIAPGHR